MLKRIGLLIGCMLVVIGGYAQCENCIQPPSNFTTDYCFTIDKIAGKCAFFSSKENIFLLSDAKMIKELPLPEGALGIDYMLSIANDENAQLSAVDMIFLNEGLTAWHFKELEMKAYAAAADIWDAKSIKKTKYGVDDTGLGKFELAEGKGAKAMVGNTVSVHYRGYLEDGSVFDTSYDRGTPFSFVLGQGQVIQGWDKGLVDMQVGSRMMLKVPSDLGYGPRSVSSIPPHSTLYFDVLVVGIR